MHARVRRERITGRGAVDNTTVVAAKGRGTGRVAADVVDRTDATTLQEFVADHAAEGAMVYTDEHRSYEGLPRHEAVCHSVGEFVNGQAHMNAWSRSGRVEAWVSRDVPSRQPGAFASLRQ